VLAGGLALGDVGAAWATVLGFIRLEDRVEVESIVGDTVRAVRHLDQVRPHLGVEAVAVHGQVGRGVALADDAGEGHAVAVSEIAEQLGAPTPSPSPPASGNTAPMASPSAQRFKGKTALALIKTPA
jgi:hypothetical protein